MMEFCGWSDWLQSSYWRRTIDFNGAHLSESEYSTNIKFLDPILLLSITGCVALRLLSLLSIRVNIFTMVPFWFSLSHEKSNAQYLIQSQLQHFYFIESSVSSIHVSPQSLSEANLHLGKQIPWSLFCRVWKFNDCLLGINKCSAPCASFFNVGRKYALTGRDAIRLQWSLFWFSATKFTPKFSTNRPKFSRR